MAKRRVALSNIMQSRLVRLTVHIDIYTVDCVVDRRMINTPVRNRKDFPPGDRTGACDGTDVAFRVTRRTCADTERLAAKINKQKYQKQYGCITQSDLNPIIDQCNRPR
jgi:hypothetical protein